MDIDELINYLDLGIQSFTDDPATTQFQQGYLAALQNVRQFVHDITIDDLPIRDEENSHDLRRE